MSYDKAVEAAAEAIGDVLGFEHSRLQNGPMARAALAAALPHLKDGYDREAIARAVHDSITPTCESDEHRGDETFLRHADAVIEVLPPLPDTTTRTVYSVQQWVDADGVRDGWCTGHGYFTHNRADAEATLAYDRRTYPAETFRLAQAQITDWEEVR